MQRSIAFVAGGTAGHVTPALVAAAAYGAAVPDARMLFLGAPRGSESRLVPLAGHRLELVSSGPLFGVDALGKARSLLRTVRGVPEARRLLAAADVQLILSFGGYASVAPMIAARTLGATVALVEPNAQPGVASRWLGRLAHRVYLADPRSASSFAAAKTRVTGVPVRAELAAVGRARVAAGTIHRPARVLVLGGSLGSPFLNREVPEVLERVAARGVPVEVWHQTGERDVGPVRAAYEARSLSFRLVSFIDDVAEALSWADFAVTCAGAVTLAELACAALPSLLVPLSYASEDHQSANAASFAAASGALWMRERDWLVDDVAGHVARILADAGAWSTLARGVHQLARPDAARDLVADCEELLRAGQ